MKKFTVVTLFPETLEPYFRSSIIGRAVKKGLIKISLVNPRVYTDDKHRTVDDLPFGGGPGMVMKAEPVLKAVSAARKGGGRVKVILTAPAGKMFNQTLARKWAESADHLIIIAGRYEGVDVRVKKILKAEEIAVGPYVLSGGELAAGVIIDAVTRHLPGVLGKSASLEEKRGYLGSPVYTRPAVVRHGGKNYRAPRVLLSGDHPAIEAWRKKHARG